MGLATSGAHLLDGMKHARESRACGNLAEEVGFYVRFAAATPPSQARSGEFLKTLHWSVFSTEFHLIGSNPWEFPGNEKAPAVARAVDSVAEK